LAKIEEIWRVPFLRALNILACLLVLSALCLAEETEYFDWKGLQNSAAKNYTDALQYFDRAIAQDPGYTDAYVHKGDTLRVMKDYNASILCYQQALEINVNKTTALAGMQEAYIALGDLSRAYAAAARMTAIDPKNKGYWLKEGNLLQMQGEYGAASAKYDGALALDRFYKDALYRKGISALAAGDAALAIDLFDEALEIDPKYKLAYNAKGLALASTGRPAEALEAYNVSTRLDPKWSLAQIDREHSLLALGEMDEAMKIFVTV